MIAYMQKLTLLDYPGHLASILFTTGCNMGCPWCHNLSLVEGELLKDRSEAEYIAYLTYIKSFLKKREGILDGVVITGGEPTIHAGLPMLIGSIKALGYDVKLDTNGTNPDMIEALLNDNAVDYVAMDLKNSPDRYVMTCGRPNLDLSPIYKTIRLLHESNVDHEFRTTVVGEFHDDYSIEAIASMVDGPDKFVLQAYRGTLFFTPTTDDLARYRAILESHGHTVESRGTWVKV